MRIHETLGGFMTLWERICEHLQGFARGFVSIHGNCMRIHANFGRGFMGICKDLQEDL